MPKHQEPRESIGKKVRFEIFKRDGFRCQYCGKSAPNVVLQIDHIVPLSGGGTNDLLNLITSCSDCNLGKGARTLDATATVTKQKQQLDELQARQEQLELLIEWKRGLLGLEEKASDACCQAFAEQFKEDKFPPDWRERVCSVVRRFGVELTLEAISISRKYYVDDALDKLGGICFYIERERKNPVWAQVRHIENHLRNRFGDYDQRYIKSICQLAKDLIGAGVDPDTIHEAITRLRTISSFKHWLEDYMDSQDSPTESAP